MNLFALKQAIADWFFRLFETHPKKRPFNGLVRTASLLVIAILIAYRYFMADAALNTLHPVNATSSQSRSPR